MSESWIEVDSLETGSIITEYWQINEAEDSKSGFWADEIKKYKDKPEKRLSLALRNLPLPKAFQEAMIALRKIISKNKKTGTEIDKELKLLYRLGAVGSMMIPYSTKLREPGYNVMESIPGAILFKLADEYVELGYEKIGLFNKSDKKAFVERWGEPKSHETMNKKHHSIWLEHENRLVKQRAAAMSELRNLLSP